MSSATADDKPACLENSANKMSENIDIDNSNPTQEKAVVEQSREADNNHDTKGNISDRNTNSETRDHVINENEMLSNSKASQNESNEPSANHEPAPGCSYMGEFGIDKIMPQNFKPNVELFTEDTEPQMYNAKGYLVTAPIITKNLPKVFEYLPVFGKPQGNTSMKEYYRSKIQEFVGCDYSDYEFDQLESYCSPEHLKMGKELVMRTNVPIMGVVTGNILQNNNECTEEEVVDTDPPDLCILKKNKMRNDKDSKGIYNKKLKYRGVRILPFTKDVYHTVPVSQEKPADVPDIELEPGKDILYRVRIYRPYTYSMAKDRFTRTRHSVFCCDILLTGRHKLSDLRDRFVCHNDFDMRVDVSNHPDMLPNTKAKEVFPSGFLFINNVFYVDSREGCIDYSEPIRAWAVRRNIGVFPKADMCTVTLAQLVLKLGYPEVYVHQGNCEHVFLFSEVRLLNASDPLRFSNYPCSTAIAQNQTVYCTTCAEFSAKWIVVGCSRVPFDPAFFCDTCFRQYLYKDGQKIGDFKAYSYRGNALNVLKPT